jgi:hypothetical protein
MYLAFCASMEPDQARRIFTRVDDVVFRGGKTWIPLDVARIGDGFIAAWQSGAKQWREDIARNQAGFFPVHEAWRECEPAQLPGSTETTLPDNEAIVSAFLDQVQQLAAREIIRR